MKSSNVSLVTGFVLIAIVFGLHTFRTYSSGHREGIRCLQREAVKACVAEYVATPDGKVEFRWISQTEPHRSEE